MSLDPENRTLICTVVFLDIVGYSKQPVRVQMEWKRQLNSMISKAIEKVAENDRVILDTGDGAALCFLSDPEEALLCALALHKSVNDDDQSSSGMLIKTGINLGPVKVVKDLNGQRNVIGDGINVAQRIMAFAESQQVLASRSFYEIVSCLAQEYSDSFRCLGAKKDKHEREHTVFQIVSPGSSLPPSNANVPKQDLAEVCEVSKVGAAQTPRPEESGLRAIDVDLRTSLETCLAEYVGPMAKILIKKATKTSRDLQELCRALSDLIENKQQREEFHLKAVSLCTSSWAASARPESVGAMAAAPETPKADAATQFDLEFLSLLEQQLIKYMGPVAKVMIKKAGRKAANAQELIEQLADQISDEHEKKTFINACSIGKGGR